jgi:lon-related putative ATP-dependent protease
MIRELPFEKLYKKCDPAVMGSSDSSQISTLKTIIGQERAVRALRFGLGIKEKGFNIFVSGSSGTGRTTAIERFLEEVAVKEPAPFDWCYVNNFHDNYHPHILRLPAGQAVIFKADMEKFIAQVARDIRNAFESEEYTTHSEEVIKNIQGQKHQLLEDLNEQAQKLDFALQATPAGLLTIPLHKGKPISEEEFLALKPEEKENIAKTQQTLETTIETVLRQVKGLDKNASEALQKLDREVTLYTIKHLMNDIQQKYQDIEAIHSYLEQVQEDILANIPDFKPETDEQPAMQLPFLGSKPNPLKKYIVNVLVENSQQQGAPVVIERHPTYNNLFGKIEQEAHFGALTTDFTLIRPGSLHKANGGYLVLPIEEVITSPLSWDSLKHALLNKEIVMEDAADKLGVISTKSLMPDPIPLDVKVILVGRSEIYQLLLAYDEYFTELFKVKADFDTQMERTDEHINDYAAFISKICEEEHLKHLDAGAMARIVEHGSRLAGDQEKLSTHFGQIADFIREASYYASLENAPFISESHVRQAIDERFYRSALIQERIKEMILRDEIKIDVDGVKSGQVNGLSVIQMGDIEFGQPSRITVSIGLGRGGLIDIEREAKLGGPIHTKGVLILSGYLTDKYAQDKPLSLTARLVFEQSYSGVEGDSASSTELYAILSALSGLPVQQGIAVTGSVNQKGEVQAIGGVNEKIEGFFAICRAKGLTGSQGVIIPESNVSNLMLKEEVVEAVKADMFHIWPVKSIDEGIEIMTGVRAGEWMPEVGFEENTVNGLVDKRLRELAEKLVEFGKKDENERSD